MLAQELIARKRDGAELTPRELQEFLGAYGAGQVPETTSPSVRSARSCSGFPIR